MKPKVVEAEHPVAGENRIGPGRAFPGWQTDPPRVRRRQPFAHRSAAALSLRPCRGASECGVPRCFCQRVLSDRGRYWLRRRGGAAGGAKDARSLRRIPRARHRRAGRRPVPDGGRTVPATFEIALSSGDTAAEKAALKRFAAAASAREAKYRTPRVEEFNPTTRAEAGLSEDLGDVASLAVRFAPIYRVPGTKRVYPELREAYRRQHGRFRAAGRKRLPEASRRNAGHPPLAAGDEPTSTPSRAPTGTGQRRVDLRFPAGSHADQRNQPGWNSMQETSTVRRRCSTGRSRSRSPRKSGSSIRSRWTIWKTRSLPSCSPKSSRNSISSYRCWRRGKRHDLSSSDEHSTARRTETGGEGAYHPRNDAPRASAVRAKGRGGSGRRCRARHDRQESGHHPDFHASVEIRGDLPAGLLVSGNRLLVLALYNLPPERLTALLSHEIGVHLLTYFNGDTQGLAILRKGLPATKACRRDWPYWRNIWSVE